MGTANFWRHFLCGSSLEDTIVQISSFHSYKITFLICTQNSYRVTVSDRWRVGMATIAMLGTRRATSNDLNINFPSVVNP